MNALSAIFGAGVAGLALITACALWWQSYRRNLDYVEAVRTRATPPFTRDAERIVYDFVTEYLETNRVAAANYKRAIDAFGEQGVVDLVGVCGYYMLVSMTLNVFEMPLPPGEPEPLA